MLPISTKDNEYICGKCKSKVGFYVITGSGENDWGYEKLKFCSSCGEKVDWPESNKKYFKGLRFVRHFCGHFSIKAVEIFCHPEEYETDHYPIVAHEQDWHECELCDSKWRYESAKKEFEERERIYRERKALQDDGENYMTSLPKDIQDKAIKKFFEENGM